MEVSSEPALETVLFQLERLPIWDEVKEGDVGIESRKIPKFLPKILSMIVRKWIGLLKERPNLRNEEAISILMLWHTLLNYPSVEQIYRRFRWFEGYISAGYDPINMAIMTLTSFVAATPGH